MTCASHVSFLCDQFLLLLLIHLWYITQPDDNPCILTHLHPTAFSSSERKLSRLNLVTALTQRLLESVEGLVDIAAVRVNLAASY